MSMPLVALCADEESVRHPELLGLAGENLSAQGWLRLFTSAEVARSSLASDARIREAWVASSDPVAPINLAAALKHDRPDLRVCMLAANDSGSLRSRASAAGIDAALTPKLFSQRYAQYKQLSAAQAVGGGGAVPGGGAASGGVPMCAVADAASEGFSTQAPAAPGFGGASVAGTPFGGAGASAPSSPFGATGTGMSATLGTQGCASQAATGFGLPGGGEVSQHTPAGFGQAGAPAASQAFPSAVSSSAAVTPGLDARAGGSLVKPSPAARQAAQPRGFLLPVVSGSGGCGKSTVSVLSALALKAAGLNTLLLDFDLQFGDMAEMLGVDRPLRIDEALAQPARLDALRPEGNLPALLAAPLRVELAESIANQAGGLIDEVRGRFDVVIANTGSAWAEQHAVLLERSSKALFLIDQRQTSLRASARALELCARCGIAVNPFVFVLNGCGKGAPLSALDASNALRGAHVHELADGGLEVEELLAGACGLELVDSGNELMEGLTGLLSEILPAEMASKLRVEDEQAGGLGLFRGGNKKPRRRKR